LCGLFNNVIIRSEFTEYITESKELEVAEYITTIREDSLLY